MNLCSQTFTNPKNFHFTVSTFPVYTYVVHTQVDPTNLDWNTLHTLSVLSHVPQQVTECTHQCLPEEAWLPWLGEGSVGTVKQQKQLTGVDRVYEQNRQSVLSLQTE